jgi:hypothetical protein
MAALPIDALSVVLQFVNLDDLLNAVVSSKKTVNAFIQSVLTFDPITIYSILDGFLLKGMRMLVGIIENALPVVFDVWTTSYHKCETRCKALGLMRRDKNYKVLEMARDYRIVCPVLVHTPIMMDDPKLVKVVAESLQFDKRVFEECLHGLLTEDDFIHCLAALVSVKFYLRNNTHHSKPRIHTMIFDVIFGNHWKKAMKVFFSLIPKKAPRIIYRNILIWKCNLQCSLRADYVMYWDTVWMIFNKYEIEMMLKNELIYIYVVLESIAHHGYDKDEKEFYESRVLWLISMYFSKNKKDIVKEAKKVSSQLIDKAHTRRPIFIMRKAVCSWILGLSWR